MPTKNRFTLYLLRCKHEALWLQSQDNIVGATIEKLKIKTWEQVDILIPNMMDYISLKAVLEAMFLLQKNLHEGLFLHS